MTKVTLTTDGSCLGNPGKGGWACILTHALGEKVLTGAEALTTNNRMELTALRKGLKALKKPCEVTVITDSKYVADGFSQWLPGWIERGWRTADKKPVQNVDLWQEIVMYASQHQLTFQCRRERPSSVHLVGALLWVKGHATHAGNNRVDDLARRAAEQG